MAIGAVDGNANGPTEALVTAYGYQIDLSTSFTGEDTLAVAIDAGQGSAALAELDLNATTGDGLTVDGITYTFPVGDKLTVLVGDSTSGSALSAQLVYMVDSLIHLMIAVTPLLLSQQQVTVFL